MNTKCIHLVGNIMRCHYSVYTNYKPTFADATMQYQFHGVKGQALRKSATQFCFFVNWLTLMLRTIKAKSLIDTKKNYFSKFLVLGIK